VRAKVNTSMWSVLHHLTTRGVQQFAAARRPRATRAPPDRFVGSCRIAVVRRPKNYRGINHETIGSDILAVIRAMNLPGISLGAERTAMIQRIQPDGWYPIQVFLDIMEFIAGSIGEPTLRKIGRTLFDMSHRERVVKSARSARDIIYGIDTMYHHANRGEEIGGWRVLQFVPGHAELEKTTPHHCIMEEGILDRALAVIGAPATVTQQTCFRRGGDACLYVIDSPIRDARWG
jgi:hypothetical protein